MVPRLDKYVGLELTLIRCIETFAMYTSGVMRRIKDDTNISGIMQVMRPYRLRLKLR